MREWTAGSDRTNNVPIDIMTSSGKMTVHVDETQNGGVWFALGTYALDPATASVTVRNGGTSGLVVADAVQFVPFTGNVTAPGAPTNLVATAASASQVKLAWTMNSDNEDGFIVEIIDRQCELSRRQAAALPHGYELRATISGLAAAGTTYYFRVRGHLTLAAAGPNAVSNAVTTQGTNTANIIVDDDDPGVIYTGNWWSSQVGSGFIGGDYRQ